MDVRFDFSDIPTFFQTATSELEAVEARCGQEAVQYAIDNGTYHNVTGRLRSSNRYRVDNGVELSNDAEYASNVEARGEDVLSGAALFLEKRLKEEIG